MSAEQLNPPPSIEIQGLSSPATPGSLVNFNFKNPVIAYAIGLNAFSVTYGPNEDHWIQNFIIKFLPVQNSSVGAPSTQVTAQVLVVMDDASGHGVNVSETTIWPVCIAVTGSIEPNTAIASANDIQSGTSLNIALPNQQSGYSLCTCFLAGFNLSFSSAGHQVLEANAGCGITYMGQTGQLSPSANLKDARGNQVQVATVDAGYIVSSYPSPGLGVAEVSGQTTQPLSVTMTGMSSVSAAAAFIRSFNVQYDDVHNVQTFKIGSWGAATVNGTVVTLPNLSANMSDNSGHTEGSGSSCDVLVIALP
jgi:hypothetical protein